MTRISVMTGLIADMAMIPYAASSDFADSWVARSGQISRQSLGRKSLRVTKQLVLCSILLQIAGPKNSLPFDESIFLM